MFISRTIYPQLEANLDEKEITLILGPRQSGKTTLLFKLKETLEAQNKPAVYFNLDQIDDVRFFDSQNTLLSKITFEKGSIPVFVFIDEIQRLKNAGLFLKGLYDARTPHKFIVTGSGSLELKSNILEPLTGRKKIFYLPTLSFKEFFEFKTKHIISQFNEYCKYNSVAANQLIDEYCIYGGYPKAILAETASKKQEVLKELYESYIEKDIKSLLDVEKDFSYRNLMKYLSGETSSLLKKSALSGNLALNIKTLNKYLFFLEKTFVIKLLRPLFKNPTKELTKTPKSYFIDLGLRNAVINRFTSFFDRDDRGKIFENFVFRQISDSYPDNNLWFWRTDKGTEIDFVLETQKYLPIEAKSGILDMKFIPKNFLSFFEKFGINRGIIIHGGQEENLEKNGKTVDFKHILL